MSSKILAELRKIHGEPSEKIPEESLDAPGDSWEEPTGDGRTSRSQILGVQLVDVRKQMVFVPYGAIIWGEGTFNGTAFRFEFVRGDRIWEAEIRGSVNLQYIVDKLSSGKRESIRVNHATVESITWREVVKGDVH